MNHKFSEKCHIEFDSWKIEIKWGRLAVEFHLVVGILAIFLSSSYIVFNNFLNNSFFYLVLSFLVPFLLFGNVLISLVFIFFRRKSLFLICLPFLFVSDIVQSFLVFNTSVKFNRPALNVMNYNVGTFDLYRFYKKSDEIIDTTYEIPQVQFLISSGADVICLQEFYNNDLIGSEAVISLLSKAGYKYYYTNPKWIDYSDGFYGVITFSKFPILKSGSIDFNYLKEESRVFNRGIYSDVIVENDTIRILNVHLHSMSLHLGELKNARSLNQLNEKWSETYRKIQVGAKRRMEQVAMLKNEIDKSPYPVLMCGDFNDLPSSFTYRFLKLKLSNVHESVGFGFGFTYNKIPWFIRIDNQFYDGRITPKYSRVLTNDTFSDHFPLMAGYEINSN